MPRPRTIAIGALALLLAASPFIPHGGGDDGSLRPSGKQDALVPASVAGPTRVTPAMRAEIERVVAEGTAATRGRLATSAAKSGPETLASALVRCADFEGQRYCLHSGWTEAAPTEVQARVASAARRISARPVTAARNTGDLDTLATLRRAAAMRPSARAAAERRELVQAARSVAKVWLLRHEIQGVPLPAGFLARHPEARMSTTQARALTAATSAPAVTTATGPKVKTAADYPQRRAILDPANVAEQTQTYWCGPTTMQMIVWGWKGRAQSQALWADKLQTTTSGTAITDMVRVVNNNTGWDDRAHAGPYITLDVGDYTYGQWMLLTERHIVDYRAPLILHPILLKRFYPYLDDDASGHFQVGRGYDKRGRKANTIGYFEPWNQQRFDPSEPYIARVQWRNAYRSYRANLAHFQHNIGV